MGFGTVNKTIIRFTNNLSSYSILNRLENFENYLSERTGISPDAIFANLSDGRRLRHDNVRDLAGVEDQVCVDPLKFPRLFTFWHTQTIYVFNKRYLDIELEQVQDELRTTATLQPPLEGVYSMFASRNVDLYPLSPETLVSTPPIRISQLTSSYTQTAQAHYENIHQTLTSMHYQHSALRISSSALDLHVLAISDVFDSLSATAQRELKMQADLLAGIDVDLSIASRVTVHKEFMNANARKALEQHGVGRTLAEYINNAKMKEVVDRSAATHGQSEERHSCLRIQY